MRSGIDKYVKLTQSSGERGSLRVVGVDGLVAGIWGALSQGSSLHENGEQSLRPPAAGLRAENF